MIELQKLIKIIVKLVLFIKNGKIFKRGPYKADYFVRVSKKEAAYSFRLRKPEKDVFGYSKNMKELEKNLKETMKYRKVR